MAYCLVDGKLEHESAFETNLYNSLLEQFKEMKAGFKTLTISILLFLSILLVHTKKVFENQSSLCQNEHLHWYGFTYRLLVTQ